MSQPASTGPSCHLIDASPYIFRAYFSVPDSLRDPAGNPVNGVYGFTNFLISHLATKRPTHVAVAFDGSLTTSFRNELYAPYKAQRELPPAELSAQLSACQAVSQALGLASFIDSRYEADDIIATLLDRVGNKAGPVTIVTPDKDLSQLVTDTVSLYDAAKDTMYAPATVMEKFGVRPDQIPDFLGLAGDAVDNIPGIAGIGKKTAAELLKVYQNLDDLYARVDSVATLSIRGAKSLALKLTNGREIALLSRELATVARNAPVTANLEQLAYKGAVAAAVDPLFEQLGFEKIRNRIPVWQ